MSKKNSSPIEKLFGSKTRVKLLTLLFENPNDSYYVREITRVIEEQVNSVRRELANMEELGIVKNESYDGKVYYSANEKHPFCRPLTEMFSKKMDTVKEIDVIKRHSNWDDLVRPVRDHLQALIVTNRLPDEEGMDMLVIGDNREKKLSNWAMMVEKKKGRPLNFMIMSGDDFMYRRSVRDKTVMDILAMPMAAVIDPQRLIKKY